MHLARRRFRLVLGQSHPRLSLGPEEGRFQLPQYLEIQSGLLCLLSRRNKLDW